MEIKCPLCGGTQWKNFSLSNGITIGYSYDEHSNINVCTGCGLMRLDGWELQEKLHED